MSIIKYFNAFPDLTHILNDIIIHYAYFAVDFVLNVLNFGVLWSHNDKSTKSNKKIIVNVGKFTFVGTLKILLIK